MNPLLSDVDLGQTVLNGTVFLAGGTYAWWSALPKQGHWHGYIPFLHATALLGWAWGAWQMVWAFTAWDPVLMRQLGRGLFLLTGMNVIYAVYVLRRENRRFKADVAEGVKRLGL